MPERRFHVHHAPVPDVVEALPDGLGNGVVFESMQHLEDFGLLVLRERFDVLDDCPYAHGGILANCNGRYCKVRRGSRGLRRGADQLVGAAKRAMGSMVSRRAHRDVLPAKPRHHGVDLGKAEPVCERKVDRSVRAED